MKITCCKNCQGRYPGCHAECDLYIEQKEHLNKFNEKKRAENEARMYRNDRHQDVYAGFALQKAHRSTNRYFRKDK